MEILDRFEKGFAGLQIHKFGGASVKDAESILNVCRIAKDYCAKGQLVVVVSAMGKTTNALEEIYHLAYHQQPYETQLAELQAQHTAVATELTKQLRRTYQPKERLTTLAGIFEELRQQLSVVSNYSSYDYGYDQIISFGELIAAFLLHWALCVTLRQQVFPAFPNLSPVVTDATWREARVDWDATAKRIRAELFKLFVADEWRIVVVQGFVGEALLDADMQSHFTTLGREGSDYSAAIFAYCLRAESVTIWKDVPGLLSADPKFFADPVLFPEISYQETIEMAYFGASVIHPKTIKPLAERKIPLYVKSFLDPAAPGTHIHDCQHAPLVPAIIRKGGQGLLSFASRDFAFISEQNLEVIFGALAAARLKINLMQNSALSFSVCVDFDAERVRQLLARLGGQFRVQYNANLLLLTIKNYDAATVERLTAGQVLLLEQRTRSTFQFLIRE